MIHILLQDAEAIANKMGYASDSVDHASGKFYQMATKTTLAVNTESQSAHGELIKLSKEFNTTFNQTIEQLHSVASEFKRTDAELHDSMNQLLPYHNPFQNNSMK